MAILCLAKDLTDLKEKMGNIYVGDTVDRQAIYARDLNAQGAMAALMKDAIKPNLVQTLEGNAAIIHGGPFANIAQGTNSVIATKMGLSLSEYVVTEAGFGADLGAEKFLNIKCGYAGISPKAIVLVATIRALKFHGGQPLDELKTPNTEALVKGFPNMEKHLENLKMYGVPAVVSINRFVSDSDEEVKLVMQRCKELGVRVAVNEGWEKGGEGVKDLASEVVAAVESCKGAYRPTYDWNDSVEYKIEAVAKKVYGAKSVVFQTQAKRNIRRIHRLGLEHLPICMAKTQSSLSDNPKLLGRPTGFELNVREIEVAAGAGFLIPILGNMLRMPGLPSVPSAEKIDIDKEGRISGLF
jgi:formate--tetrahydrofolate ligase